MSLGLGLLYGPTGGGVLMSEVPLYLTEKTPWQRSLGWRHDEAARYTATVSRGGGSRILRSRL